MINALRLLDDLKRRVTVLDYDPRECINTVPDLKASLQTGWRAAGDADHTAETFDSWADQVVTQDGVRYALAVENYLDMLLCSLGKPQAQEKRHAGKK